MTALSKGPKNQGVHAIGQFLIRCVMVLVVVLALGIFLVEIALLLTLKSQQWQPFVPGGSLPGAPPVSIRLP